MEELVVCEVAQAMGQSVKDILNGGYFEAHRVWSILSEINSKNLFDLSIATSIPHLTEEARQQHFDFLKTMQPRRYPIFHDQAMPKELMNEFREKFKKATLDGRLKQNRN